MFMLIYTHNIGKNATQLPLFTCSWMLLCTDYLKETRSCLCNVQTLQRIRNKTTSEDFSTEEEEECSLCSL